MKYQTLFAVVLSSSLCLLSACGKKGALVYPDNILPPQASIAVGRSVGTGIRLYLNIPAQNRQETAKRELADSILVLRSDKALVTQACSSCPDKLPLYKTIYLTNIKESEKSGGRIVFNDTDIVRGAQYRYRVQLASAEGGISPQSLHVEVTAFTPAPPPKVTIENRPAEVFLNMAPEKPESGSFAGYIIYRKLAGETGAGFPLTQEPVKEDFYSDFKAVQGERYIYTVRRVIKSDNGELFESLASPEVEGRREDYE